MDKRQQPTWNSGAAACCNVRGAVIRDTLVGVGRELARELLRNRRRGAARSPSPFAFGLWRP